MKQGPDQPDENAAEATIGLFGSDTGEGTDRGRTEPMAPLPVENRTAGEVTERDSTSQEVTAASPPRGPAEEEAAPTAHSPAPSPGSDSHDLPPGPVVPEPGKVLFGTYLVERPLGGGAMGTVWLVQNLELNKLRALKLIVPGFAFDPAAQARFRREAQVMALVEHPNAVTVHAARISRDVAYIEMEYVSGKSLDRILQRGVPMPLNWVARVLAQLCDVLQEAHGKQVVHRDLKPSNLMLVDTLNPAKLQLKVLDFGIAKVLENDNSDVHTTTGQFMGTAQYTSPEQASGGAVDHRSDIYSVGVILYELLTGARPFTGPVHQLIFGHLYSPPPRFAERTPPVDVPPAVEEVVLRCLAKNPDDRFQSALAVSEAFSTAVFGVSSPPAPRPESWSVSIPNPVAEPGVGAVGRPAAHREGVRRCGDQAARLASMPQPAEKARRDRRRLGIAPDLDHVPRHVEAIAEELDHPRRRGRRAAARPGIPAPGPEPGFRPPLAPRLQGREPSRHGQRPPPGPRPRTRRPPIHPDRGGEFLMGNNDDADASGDDEDQPAHPVKLSDFYMQETEVTNGEMEAYFVEEKIRSREASRSGG